MDKKFKHYIVEFDTPQIYCDMDGVLADFEKGVKNMIGGQPVMKVHFRTTKK